MRPIDGADAETGRESLDRITALKEGKRFVVYSRKAVHGRLDLPL